MQQHDEAVARKLDETLDGRVLFDGLVEGTCGGHIGHGGVRASPLSRAQWKSWECHRCCLVWD